jgi:hypothetical protein
MPETGLSISETGLSILETGLSISETSLRITRNRFEDHAKPKYEPVYTISEIV